MSYFVIFQSDEDGICIEQFDSKNDLLESINDNCWSDKVFLDHLPPQGDGKFQCKYPSDVAVIVSGKIVIPIEKNRKITYDDFEDSNV